MLHIIKGLDDSVIQRLKKGAIAKTLFRAAFNILDIDNVRVASNHNERCALVFYSRYYIPEDDYDGLYETVIFYGPGPACQDPKKFLIEMLRIFYQDKKYFDIIWDYYITIVKRKKLHYIEL